MQHAQHHGPQPERQPARRHRVARRSAALGTNARRFAFYGGRSHRTSGLRPPPRGPAAGSPPLSCGDAGAGSPASPEAMRSALVFGPGPNRVPIRDASLASSRAWRRGTPATRVARAGEDRLHVARVRARRARGVRRRSRGACWASTPERVFKTLVARTTDDRHVVGIVPVATQLDLKALAAAVDAKHADMARPADAQRLTGYVLGGISPLGQKRRLADGDRRQRGRVRRRCS